MDARLLADSRADAVGTLVVQFIASEHVDGLRPAVGGQGMVSSNDHLFDGVVSRLFGGRGFLGGREAARQQ